MEPLLTIKKLSVEYDTRRGPVEAVQDVTLDVQRGEIIGLVGESGSGKSTLGRALLRMIPSPGRISSGEIQFDGTDLMGLTEDQMRAWRGTRIGMVFQDPMTSLVPVEKVITQIRHTVHTHDPGLSRAEIDSKARALAQRLGIRPERLEGYPHQLSGGMRQRVMIAIALILDAEFVIADEPTTALDVIVEAQFLDLLRELRDELGIAILLITHNIGVVAQVADRVAVMYAGRIVEVGDVKEVFAFPRHPYTQGLLKSVPNIELDGAELYRMEGNPPNLSSRPTGCPFHPRCPQAMDIYIMETPPLGPVGDSQVACWLYPTVVSGKKADA